MEKIRVLVAGIGGASLGEELAKSIRTSGDFWIGGCDISELAYGHYSGNFDQTFIVDRKGYAENIVDLCRKYAVKVLIPGGDEPARILSECRTLIESNGIRLAGNDPQVVAIAADKKCCFEFLGQQGIRIPLTASVERQGEPPVDFPLPAIVKPAIESGGSSFVFFARNSTEIALYCEYLRRNGLIPIVQEYISHEGGEFTVGVLSDRSGEVVGAVALKRSFHVKLSVAQKGPDFLISSGYSQGYIGEFPGVIEDAIKISKALGSRGPLNVQGRIGSGGVLIPFEVNPRFSASTYLRTLAGFNEAHYHIYELLGLPRNVPVVSRFGWYLRGLAEKVVVNGGLAR